MNIAIIFDSVTGNTEQVAKAVGEACSGEDMVVFGRPGKDIPRASLIFAGSWTDRGNCSAAMAEFLSRLHGKSVALFGTMGFGESEDYAQGLFERTCPYLPEDNRILGYFYCSGKLPINVRNRCLTMMRDNPGDQRLHACIQNFDYALSHPDETDLARARQFAHNIVNQYRKEAGE